jgi:hypothetical protein
METDLILDDETMIFDRSVKRRMHIVFGARLLLICFLTLIHGHGCRDVYVLHFTNKMENVTNLHLKEVYNSDGRSGAVRGSCATAVLNLRVFLWNYESSKMWG